MKNPSELAPTDPLSGLHMRGVVTRRFLVTYRVPPDRLLSAVPPGCELMVDNGFAWVSACFVNIAAMRPSLLPAWAGTGFNYLIHRTMASVPYPDGRSRRTVLVLEANINRGLLGSIARRLTGVQFRTRQIDLIEQKDAWIVRMRDRGETLYEVEIDNASIGARTPPASLFASVSEADRILLGVSFGAQWDRDRETIKLLAETHDPWQTLVGTCITRRHALLTSLGLETPQADHVITMTDIPHYFALRGLVVPCPAPRDVQRRSSEMSV
jgi:uncharacterized protein YqjF (DUF2071 family)